MSKERFRICKLNNGRYIIQRQVMDENFSPPCEAWADLDEMGSTRSEVNKPFNHAHSYYDVMLAYRALESFRPWPPTAIASVAYEDDP